MEGRVLVWVALLLATATAAATAAAAANKQGYIDPCARHTCPVGEECVSHEVSCRRRPCPTPRPRISECRAANCSLPCRDGYECSRRPQPCGQPPCPSQEQCVRLPDACNGRCRPDDLCMTRVELRPCPQPPCVKKTESYCVGSGVTLTARHQPPPPSFCSDCPAPAVCVATKVCRQFNECVFLPVCLSNCTEMWCGHGHKCSMSQSQQCNGSDCPPEPACVPEEPPSAADQQQAVPEVQLANRFSGLGEPQEPQCVVTCTPGEECRRMPTRCRNQPCPIVSRCVPRLRPGRPASAAAASSAASPPNPAGDCPLDDLRQLASPAFCAAASLHQCAADADCGQQRRCCDRGCGRSCLPSCRPGCQRGTECRLVAVQCLGSPCPKVAQCVAAEEPQLLPPPPPAASSQQRPSRPRPAESSQQRPSRPPPQFGNGASASASSGASSSASSSSASSVAVADAVAPSRVRPGLCPVNDRQTRSKICFDNGSVDKCASDDSCPAGERCCLRGCQRMCRPICNSCAAGLQCQLLQVNRPPACLPPLDQGSRRRF